MVNLQDKPNSSHEINSCPSDKQKNIRLLIVDDQNFIRQKLKLSLESQSDIQVIGICRDGITAIEQIALLKPDIVLIDIEMPRMDGLTATKIIFERFANTKVIVFSSYDKEEYINKTIMAGAQGYLLKTTTIEEIVRAICFVHKDYLQLGPGLSEKLRLSSPAIIKSPQAEISLENKSQKPTQLVNNSHELQTINNDWSTSTKELVDTLPRIWTRGLLYFLLIFVGIILPWSMLSKVEETGSAKGRLEPQGRVYAVDAPVTGTVTEVWVKEGQKVKEKEPLLKLESEPIESELKQINTRLEGQKQELAQLKLLQNQLLLASDTQEQQNKARQLEKQAQVNQVQQNLLSLSNALKLQKAEKQSQIEQAQQNLEHSQTALELAKIAQLKTQEELKRYTNAKEQGIVSEIQVVEIESSLRERNRLLEQAKADVKQADLQFLEQQKNYQKLVHEISSEISQAQLQQEEQQESFQSLIHAGKIASLKVTEQLQEIAKQISILNTQIKENKSQVTALKYQLEQRIIKSPANGIIFQLPIHKNGEVVNPGELVAEVSPEHAFLVLKAQMLASESGSLDRDMPVKLKFDAYPFQDYGVVSGKLTDISPTTKITDTEQGQIAAYELEIALEQDYIETKNKRIKFRPGQTATAEVIVRQRRLIDFVIEPFQKLQKGGLEL